MKQSRKENAKMPGVDQLTGSLAGSYSPATTESVGSEEDQGSADFSAQSQTREGFTVISPARKRRPLSNEDQKASAQGKKATRKIPLADGFFIGLYALAIDVLGILFILIGGEDFGLVDLLGIGTNFYFYLKNIPKGIRKFSTSTSLAELLPLAGVLPMKFIGVLLVLYYDKNPKKAKKVMGKLGQK